ncbi:hypothetical protein CR513_07681, partial [Mucuna pruriens]
MASTKCTKTKVGNISIYYFDFIFFPNILGGTYENVIYHVVQKSDLKEIDKNDNKIMLIDILLGI